MSKNFRMEGHQEVINALRNADKVVKYEGTRFLDGLGQFGSDKAKEYTFEAGAIDLGELFSGIHHTTTSRGNEITTTIRPSDKADEYAIYVERGTKPHRPPISALQGWADRHGIPVWAVVRKIELEGTEPRYMWRDAYNDLVEKTESASRSFAKRLAREL